MTLTKVPTEGFADLTLRYRQADIRENDLDAGAWRLAHADAQGNVRPAIGPDDVTHLQIGTPNGIRADLLLCAYDPGPGTWRLASEAPDGYQRPGKPDGPVSARSRPI